MQLPPARIKVQFQADDGVEGMLLVTPKHLVFTFAGEPVRADALRVGDSIAMATGPATLKQLSATGCPYAV